MAGVLAAAERRVQCCLRGRPHRRAHGPQPRRRLSNAWCTRAHAPSHAPAAKVAMDSTPGGSMTAGSRLYAARVMAQVGRRWRCWWWLLRRRLSRACAVWGLAPPSFPRLYCASTHPLLSCEPPRLQRLGPISHPSALCASSLSPTAPGRNRGVGRERLLRPPRVGRHAREQTRAQGACGW